MADSVGKLIDRLDSAEPLRQSRARRQLVEQGDAAVPALIRALTLSSESKRSGLRGRYRTWREEVEPGATVAEHAARALGEIGNPKAGPALGKVMVASADESVRFACAEALAEVGDRRTIRDLMQALGDQYYFVRWAAARALGRMKATGAGDVLAERLADDPDDFVREAAAVALGELGDDRWVPNLMKALKDNDERVRQSAASSLARLT